MTVSKTKETCTATSKRSGLRCRKGPAPGQRVCRLHGGNSPQAKAAAKARMLRTEWEVYVTTYGIAVEIEPNDAIIGEVKRAAGAVTWLSSQVQALAEDQITTTDERGVERPSVVVQLFNEERDRLVRISKIAIDAGIDARRVALEEDSAQKLVLALLWFLQQMGLSDSPVAKVKMHEMLETLARGETPA